MVSQLVFALISVAYEKDRIYEMNGSFKFMDAYDRLMHLILILDEFGSMNKDKLEPIAVDNLTKITGEAPFEAPMADINKMGT